MEHAHAAAGVRTIFAHLDVLGASVNNKQQAVAGLPVAAFPAGVPVFTGHYHKPHTVPKSAITYIGSPFQRTILRRCVEQSLRSGCWSMSAAHGSRA